MSDPKPQQPFERIFDLNRLSEAGTEIDIAPSADELVPLAEWLEVEAVERFAAAVTLRRLSSNRFSYAAEFSADVVQSCVVTLEPVRSHIAQEFARELHLVGHRHAPKAEVLTLAAAEDDVPEEIESPRFDLAGPVLEELSLAIDPYPRAPGVEFEPPADSAGESKSPLAALDRLKSR